MLDKHRFANRARELSDRAKLIEDLSRMPDRATEKDLRQTADLLKRAASDLEELTAATPTGCICRCIKGDNYDYLDYEEACLHHGSLFRRERQLKEGYQKMEKSLKNELRIKLIAAALTGSAIVRSEGNAHSIEAGDSMARKVVHFEDAIQHVERALMIADQAIRQITESA